MKLEKMVIDKHHNSISITTRYSNSLLLRQMAHFGWHSGLLVTEILSFSQGSKVQAFFSSTDASLSNTHQKYPSINIIILDLLLKSAHKETRHLLHVLQGSERGNKQLMTVTSFCLQQQITGTAWLVLVRNN